MRRTWVLPGILCALACYGAVVVLGATTTTTDGGQSSLETTRLPDEEDPAPTKLIRTPLKPKSRESSQTVPPRSADASLSDEKRARVSLRVQKLGRKQAYMLRRVKKFNKAIDEKELASILASDSNFNRSLAKALKSADKAVSEDLRAREAVKNRFMAKLIAEGRFESLSAKANVPEPRRGELIVTCVRWDPELKMDIRKLVRLHPGVYPEMDGANAAWTESKRLRRVLINDLVSTRMKQ